MDNFKSKFHLDERERESIGCPVVVNHMTDDALTRLEATGKDEKPLDEYILVQSINTATYRDSEDTMLSIEQSLDHSTFQDSEGGHASVWLAVGENRRRDEELHRHRSSKRYSARKRRTSFVGNKRN